MKGAIRYTLLLGFFFISSVVRADVLVLVHGYLGSAASWERSGVSAVLSQHGWQRAGLFSPTGLLPGPGMEADNKLFAVELPSQAPLGVQSRILQSMVAEIEQRFPNESVILVGHSAGGVVARLLLVQGGVQRPKALITIATPHLGTIRAVEALNETDDPFPVSLLKEFFSGDIYDVVRDSWGVLLDLTPARPGNLLYWLNRQVHPEISYTSIVRPGPIGMGDELVPVFSQDMNSVQALRDRSKVEVVPVSHALQPADGFALVKLLQAM